ncbi:ABC transporter substrate-binding protein [Arthrobacter jiangjiafuii]|uniref:ABC transporter substrate-binding protein n=1 Tax=Arthrobacter jiangjiafuii TaxID=2817475 RepID=A0A975M414_9MICC|nr:ABC transporter substrate-binding protein [Arthrobacter jiangjiafuii]MBP3044502.1 ABC transporter substrate-binding protein [Arthrobacter jiangjiafuii]QWC09389.1 ABC transporter substrate-binding protein [Arthrobacter jiangjiafuii]
MRFTRTSKLLSVAAVAMLALSACGGGSDESGSTEGAGDATAIITANGTEPQNPLMPVNTNEVGGGRIMDLLFEGLVSYDANGATVNELAESIETEDSQTYTIKLKADQKFTNDEAITAKSFVDAWNFGAAAKNAQLNSYFFESIEGYDDVSAENATVDTMSGLTVVDDTTFTVKLSQPESDFPQRLGYTAFFPLPAGAVEDPKTFGENPVGNGPYMLAGEGAWEHEIDIDLVANPDYTGTRVPQNGGVTFKFYSSFDAAYADLQSDNLDILDTMPNSALKTFKTDLGEGRYSEKAYAGNQTITIPGYLPEFSGEAGQLRRQAISMAINRDEITEVVFSGSREPATEFTAPVIDGYSDSVPGNEVLEFNPEKAKELWAQAEEISPWPAGQAFTLGYNADANHKEWVDAVANGLKNNLGITAEGKPYATFKELRADATAKSLTGAIRTGWQADYPSLNNFLGPLYGTGAGSNDGDYSSEEFDSLLSDGLAASSPEEGSKIFNQAQEVLLKDLPVIPLWYQVAQSGWSNNVDNVETGWNGVPVYYNVTAK